MSRFIITPILDRLAKALRSELNSLTFEDLQQLDKECQRTTTTNCEFQRRAIAELYADHVHAIVYNSKRSSGRLNRPLPEI